MISAALFDACGKLLFVPEDVGRHNAVDKVIGATPLQKCSSVDQQILMVNGRASFKTTQKALVAGMPSVAAVSAP